MSFTPNTNYYITQTNPDGSKQLVDLSELFNGGTALGTTNFKFLNPSGNYVDINTIFNAITTETPIAETGYKTEISGVLTDLNLIFQPKLTASSYFTISANDTYPDGRVYNYKTLSSGGYFYILIPADGQISGDQIGSKITFNTVINNINIVMVAGGGAGRMADTVVGGSGIGGGGGGVVDASFNATIGDAYNMYIGPGSNGDSGGYITRTSLTKTDYNTSDIKLEVIGGYDGATWGTAGNISPLSVASQAVFTILGGGSGGNGGASVTVAGGKGPSNNGLPSALPIFTTPSAGSIYLGCGGGAGDYTVTGTGAFGGTAGSHVGGEGGICGAYSPNVTGEGGAYRNGKFGSGGGGGAYNPTDGNNGWKSGGGDGVILIYFPI